MLLKNVFVAKDGNGTEIGRKESTKAYTHAVVATRTRSLPSERGKAGGLIVLRWTTDEQLAVQGVKDFQASSWGGAWKDVHVRPVEKTELQLA